MTNKLQTLVDLTRTLGKPENDYVIIGEGNTSCVIDDASFYVKASGNQINNITENGFVAVNFAPILELIDNPPATMTEQKAIMQSARVDQSNEVRPSVEVTFHAMLLKECGVQFIGHTHPTAINQIMCSTHAADFALKRRFPDEVVLCGPQSVLVPYVDPGLPLAIVMRDKVREYMDKNGEAPKVILLENHGVIALGDTPSEILNIMAMVVKGAKIFAGALMIGSPTFMTDEDIWHIYKRPDEIYRRQLFVDDAQSE
jgi:rhamnose utilization protein RhaD (predicted bifunctional aldolase and dehydrogenase)